MIDPMKVFRNILAASVAFMVFGCVSNVQEPTVVAEARALSREGNEAYREGKLEASKQAYGRALELHHSIDAPTGIIRDLINLAVVSKASGNPSDAVDCLEAIDRYASTLHASGSDPSEREEINGLLREAGWMRAYLACDAGNPATARTLLARTVARYGEPDRDQAGRHLNLEARIDLDEGNAARALSTAKRALKTNQRTHDSGEIADSLRILGKAQLQTGSPDDARGSFAEALKIDRQQGRPSKVVDDLLGMAEASGAAGRTLEANASAQRALTAARAARDAEGESKARRMILRFQHPVTPPLDA
jgi:tetratricopeptide (TPR) repeat protein